MPEWKQNFTGGIRSAEFAVRENNTLAVRLQLASETRTLVFHDSIRKGGRRVVFHEKTGFYANGNVVELRAAAIDPKDGAPIPGLLVTYRFTFDETYAAAYLAVSLESDARCAGCAMHLLDFSWEDFAPSAFTGYEENAAGEPFAQTFEIPADAVQNDYETAMHLSQHVAWEKMKIQPYRFRRAVALEGKDGYLCVLGGSPTYAPETGSVSVLADLPDYDRDLRFFSGQNAVGAWLLLEKPDDPLAVLQELESRIPQAPATVAVPFCEEKIALSSGRLSARLLRAPSGVWVEPIARAESGEYQPQPLFTLDLYNPETERSLQLDSGDGWDSVEILQRKSFTRITLSDPDCGRIPGISVIAEAVADEAQDRLLWKLRVVNCSSRFCVERASYPQLPAAGFDTAFVPIASGAQLRHVNRRCTTVYGKYPWGVKINMAFAALYDPLPLDKAAGAYNGLYYGVHDAEGNPKYLSLAGAPASDCTMLSFECVAPYRRTAGNSYTLPGTAVWQRFSGDWFDAANLYRAFVHSGAEWLSPLRGRSDVPAWLREGPVWLMHFLPNENPDAAPVPTTVREKYHDKTPADWYKLAVRFAEKLGLPVAYHLYNWHWAPFNNDNPNYFPTHHDLKKGLRELKQAGIRVVPYVVGYSWDMCDSRGDDFRFGKQALPATAKNLDGSPINRSLATFEPSGQPVRFARMCPSTALWKNELRQITRRLCAEYGADGIYLDVVTAQYHECCDAAHPHPHGYGAFWHKSYSELMAGLRAGAPEDFAVMSESTSEVYSAAVDGFLSWTWVQPDSVPAYPRVYGGRATVFGRIITHNARDNADYFRFQIAQSLTFGQQLGWIHPELVDDAAQFPYLKKIAALRWKYRDFFPEAEMLRPPVIEGNTARLDCRGYLRVNYLNHELCVTAGAWEDMAGRRCLFILNSTDREAEVTLSFYDAEYKLPEAPALTESDGFELLGNTSDGGVHRLSCRIAPEGYGVLEWTPGKGAK